MTTIAESKALALAKQFNIEGSPTELIGTLKATAFKGNATNEHRHRRLFIGDES